MKKLTLVLGGGASKGFAHLGVIKALEQNGINIDYIVGNSMGAIIGGLYACGKDCNYLLNLASQLTRKKIVDFNLFNLLYKDSILSGKKLKNLLTKEIGETLHQQTKIPFVAVATIIEEGKLVVLKDGKVLDSIMASSAIPGVYPSVDKNGKQLCDGGLLNNLPEDVARKLTPNHIILSVDVIGNYKKQTESCKCKIIESTINSITLMQTEIVRLKNNDSDLKISITQPDVAQMSFNRQSIKKSIKYGEDAMINNLEKLKKLLQD